MTTKAVKAMFWKEYRQQILLLAAIFLLGILFQFSACLSSLFVHNTPAYWSLGMFVTALYAAGAAGVLFAREHDEKTFGFLRSLPLTADTILVGKLTWLLSSTLLLGLLMGFESLFWVAFAGTGDSGPLIFGVAGVAVVEALCWGLFWSVRSRSQLNALLATFLSASIGAYAMSLIWNYTFGGGNQLVIDMYAGGAVLRLPLALAVGAIALLNARKWLYRQMGRPLPTLTPTQLTRRSKKLLARPRRGEMRWLLWLAFRQSRTAFLYLGLTFALMIGVLAAFYKNVFPTDALFELTLALLLGLAVGLAFCSSVFFRDQQNNAAAMLTHRGIAAGKIWWSRMLVFGAAYALYCIPLVVIYLTVAFSRGNDLFTFFLCNEGYNSTYILRFWDIHVRAEMWHGLYVAVTLFGAIFCFGQMISLFLRSFLAAIPVVAAMFCGVFFWVMIVKYLLGYEGLFWAVWPVLIGCLLASRLRAANWQRGRNTWLAWRPPLLAVALPAVLILCLIPFVRVYSVPVVYLGYGGEVPGDVRFAWRSPDVDPLHYYITIGPTGGRGGEYVKPAQGSPRSNDVVENVRNALKRNHACYGDNQSSYRYVFSQIDTYFNHATVDLDTRIDAPPEFLQHLTALQENMPETSRQLITLLENEPKTRPALRERIARDYYRAYRDLEQLPALIRNAVPWEKRRFMRMLNYEFQLKSQLADSVEQLVYHNQGGYNMVANQGQVVRFNLGRQYYDLFFSTYFIHGGRLGAGYDNATDIYWVLDQETRRRAMILQLALHAYYLEHGKLPETLAELEDGYLTKVPTVPITGDAFEYHPAPPADEVVSYTNYDWGSEKHTGMPYLRVPVTECVSNTLPIDGRAFPLEFVKRKIAAE